MTITEYAPTITDLDAMATIYNDKVKAIEKHQWLAGEWVHSVIIDAIPDYYETDRRYGVVAEFVKSIAHLSRQSASTPRNYAWIWHLFGNDYDTEYPHTVYLRCAKTEKRGVVATKDFAKRWLELYISRGWCQAELEATIAAIKKVNNKVADPALVDSVSVDDKPITETLIRAQAARVVNIDGGVVTLDFAQVLDGIEPNLDVVVTVVTANVFEAEE